MSEQLGRTPPDVTKVLNRTTYISWGNPEIIKAPILWENGLMPPTGALSMVARAVKSEGYTAHIKPISPDIYGRPMVGVYVNQEARRILDLLTLTGKFLSLVQVVDKAYELDPRFDSIMHFAQWDEVSARQLHARKLEKRADLFMDMALSLANSQPLPARSRLEKALRRSSLEFGIASVDILGDLDRLTDEAMLGFVHKYVKSELKNLR